MYRNFKIIYNSNKFVLILTPGNSSWNICVKKRVEREVEDVDLNGSNEFDKAGNNLLNGHIPEMIDEQRADWTCNDLIKTVLKRRSLSSTNYFCWFFSFKWFDPPLILLNRHLIGVWNFAQGFSMRKITSWFLFA